jgi:hypothetical protein
VFKSPFLQKWYSTQVDWLSTVVRLYLADDVTGTNTTTKTFTSREKLLRL